MSQVVALTLPSLTSEFGVSSNNVRYTTCATFVGLCLGASFWGIGADLIGRRLAFNTTLFLAGVFGLAVGGGPSWVGTCGLFAALGFGVGGNLPVDGVCLNCYRLFGENADFPIGTLSRVSAQRVSELTDSVVCVVAAWPTSWLTHCLGFPLQLYL